jgi:hypothetical protein
MSSVGLDSFFLSRGDEWAWSTGRESVRLVLGEPPDKEGGDIEIENLDISVNVKT